MPDEVLRQQLADALLDRARALQERMTRMIGTVEPPPDLTLRQIQVLYICTRQPGVTSSELAQALGVAAPTTSGLVDRLVRHGLLRRTDDPNDRRRRRLQLTEAGTNLVEELEGQTRRAAAMVVPMLSLDELSALVAGYEVMLLALDRLVERAAEQADRG